MRYLQEPIWVGFMVNDVVSFNKIWCVICARSRWHEAYGGWVVCPSCGEVTPETKPEIN